MSDAGRFVLESIQIAFFFKAPKSIDVEEVVSRSFRTPIDTVEKKGSVGPTTAKLTIDSWLVQVTANPTRLDLLVSPQLPTELDFENLESPGTADVDGALSEALKLAKELFSSLGPFVRIGVVAQSVQPFRKPDSARARLLSQLPFAMDAPPEVNDLALQFNYPTPSRTDNAITLNRLFAWQTLSQQNFSVGPQGVRITEWTALKGVLDVNTAKPPAENFELGDALVSELLPEMIGVVKQVFSERSR